MYKISPNTVRNINFRDKSLGWKKFSFTLQLERRGKKKHITEVFYRNYYRRGFLHDIYLRPSCYLVHQKEENVIVTLLLPTFGEYNIFVQN